MIVWWLEELSQYDMVIQCRPCSKCGTADGVPHHPYHIDYCDCYEAGCFLSSLPCVAGKYCTKIHN